MSDGRQKVSAEDLEIFQSHNNILFDLGEKNQGEQRNVVISSKIDEELIDGETRTYKTTNKTFVAEEKDGVVTRSLWTNENGTTFNPDDWFERTDREIIDPTIAQSVLDSQINTANLLVNSAHECINKIPNFKT